MSKIAKLDLTNLDPPKLVVSIVVCFLAAGLGTVFTSTTIETWYVELEKPFFNPPNWVFGPVWTVLYLLMAVSLYLVWLRGIENREVRTGIAAFAVQLVLNVAWSGAFFGLRSPSVGLAVIIALWVAILWTIVEFYGISKKAAYLLLPYIAWVSFAVVLNFYIWGLN